MVMSRGNVSSMYVSHSSSREYHESETDRFLFRACYATVITFAFVFSTMQYVNETVTAWIMGVGAAFVFGYVFVGLYHSCAGANRN